MSILVPSTLTPLNAVDAMTERNLVPCCDGQIANFVQAMRRATARRVFAPLPGGMTLTPGVYFFSSSAQLTGTLTPNDQCNPNAVFVFQIGSTLTAASNSVVIFYSSLTHQNVYWQVGSFATPRHNHGVLRKYSCAHQDHP